MDSLLGLDQWDGQTEAQERCGERQANPSASEAMGRCASKATQPGGVGPRTRTGYDGGWRRQVISTSSSRLEM